ncbi:hypothetical protein MACK_003673 [Theileria orientalis]|uniref:Uncharacterized protein n=1 Tax=Theileria orientalis TaxID=68886 RepID=A0A976SJI4_THEOR|nr:hypothetical protein MACK_003673 [Theileria orientalis]
MDVSNGKREPKVSFSFFKGPLDKSSENGSVKNSRDHGNGNDSNTNSPPSKHRKFMTKATKSAENHSNGLSTGKDKAKNSETFKGMKGNFF